MKKPNSRVILLYPSELKFESRIEKTAAIVESYVGSECVDVLGMTHDGQLILARLGSDGRLAVDVHSSINRIGSYDRGNLKSGKIKQLLLLLGWVLKIIGYLRVHKDKYRVVSAHSIHALPALFMLRLLRWRGRLVYEPHEFEPYSRSVPKRLSKYLFSIENWLLKKVDAISVVGASIGLAYKQFDKKLWVVPNYPAIEQMPMGKPLQSSLRKRRPLKVVYCGLYVSGRSCERLIDIAPKFENDVEFSFVGYGPNERQFKESASSLKNVQFFDAVPRERLVDFLSQFDVGVCVIEPICESYRLSMPNKLFEYLFAGLTVVIGESPDARELLRHTGGGVECDGSIEGFVSSLNQLLATERLPKADIHILRNFYSWENVKDNVLKIYGLNYD